MIKQFVVFWNSEFIGKNPGYTTPQVNAKFKDFDTISEADKLVQRLKLHEQNNQPYQSRTVRNVVTNY